MTFSETPIFIWKMLAELAHCDYDARESCSFSKNIESSLYIRTQKNDPFSSYTNRILPIHVFIEFLNAMVVGNSGGALQGIRHEANAADNLFVHIISSNNSHFAFFASVKQFLFIYICIIHFIHCLFLNERAFFTVFIPCIPRLIIIFISKANYTSIAKRIF